jgi:asparagine synthase (glutamine-hydrolysing)
MFNGRLAFEDFDSPLGLVDGGIFLGSSYVIPVAHRLLGTSVIESRERVAILSWERLADEPEGVGHEGALSDGALQARIEAMEAHPLDWALLVIDRAARMVRYTASPVVSIPVFVRADAGDVSIDWDYARLLGTGEAEIVWDVALAQMAGLPVYGPRTVVAGVYRATAGATLVAGPRGVEAVLPTPIVHLGAQEVAAGADIERLLFDAVCAIVAARPLEPERTAVEMSGGMDSALTASAAAAVLGPGLMSVGAQFSGAMGEAQRARRLLLCGQGAFDDLSMPAERFAPFSPTSLRRVRYGVWPEDENYPEMFEAMFGMLRAAGIDALISGFGGDELYFSYLGEEEEAAAEGAGLPCPFLTPRGREMAEAARTSYPRGWLQESCWQSAASQAQRVLRYGLWPVYPYHHPALARFVSRLPYAYRRDRALLRRTLTSVLGAPAFEAGYVKESFDAVAVRGIVENRDYLIDLVRRSPLARHPEVDDEAIVAALEGDVAGLERDRFNALFRVLKIVCFFQGRAPTER